MNIILTGASKGIGYQTAISLSRLGIDNLILIARSKDLFEELKK